MYYLNTELEEVVSVYKSEPRKYRLQTTRSWEFSGVEESVQPNSLNKDDLLLKARYGKDVIIGVLDSGTYIYICLPLFPMWHYFLYFRIGQHNLACDYRFSN